MHRTTLSDAERVRILTALMSHPQLTPFLRQDGDGTWTFMFEERTFRDSDNEYLPFGVDNVSFDEAIAQANAWLVAQRLGVKDEQAET